MRRWAEAYLEWLRGEPASFGQAYADAVFFPFLSLAAWARGGESLTASLPPTPTVPENAGTATKVLILAAFLFGIIAAVTFPTGYSMQIGSWSASIAIVLGAAAGGIHAIWDHSP